jgi:uncharacterized protein
MAALSIRAGNWTMAGASLLMLLDDIATVLDDVALMTRMAAKKTAGVLGDDLALNAQQLSGVRAERELPVVWAVARGSALNKLILVPLALAISALAPWAITPLLMVGGTYLCYEGFEKLAHRFLHGAAVQQQQSALRSVLIDPEADLLAFERDRIRGAIRTDFILSAEIVVIALGTVQAAPFGHQVAVVAGIAALMTVGVYGFVALIVRMDDVGAALLRRDGASALALLQRALGSVLLSAAPGLMKLLAVVGTAAMFLVGGGILMHGVPALTQGSHALESLAALVPLLGPSLAWLSPLIASALVGVIAGALALGAIALAARARKLIA